MFWPLADILAAILICCTNWTFLLSSYQIRVSNFNFCENKILYHRNNCKEMWPKGSKPVACRYLDIELEDQECRTFHPLSNSPPDNSPPRTTTIPNKSLSELGQFPLHIQHTNKKHHVHIFDYIVFYLQMSKLRGNLCKKHNCKAKQSVFYNLQMTKLRQEKSVTK